MNKHQKNYLFHFFLIGIHLALLQYAYLFLLEAYVSSRAVTYFICLFFWLIGFLLGLNLLSKVPFWVTILAGWVTYEIAYFGNQLYPYKDFLYPVFAFCLSVSGIQAGRFFLMVSDYKEKLGIILYHENNGFVIGTLFSLIAVLYAGSHFLMLAPTLFSITIILSQLRLEKKTSS